MAKAPKRAFVCNECGADYPRWQGQCSACHAWNTITEVRGVAASPSVARNERLSGYAGNAGVAKVQKLSDISLEELPRFSTGFKEFDRVLGGGVVPGSAILIGGNPGAGKSTLLLQTLCKLAEQMKTLYVTGEESLQQVAMRAHRLGLPTGNLNMLSETSIEQICMIAEEEQPKLMVIDSIQVMHMADIQSSPGSVAQVRETAAYLTRFAKTRGVAIVMVGHVTKDGSLAGPKVLEHCIDCSVMLDGDADSRFRTLRSHKNRFGAVNELGVFAMTEQGLREVSNPSAIFLSRGDEVTSGSSVMVLWEGTRPLLVEIQALVDHSMMGNPRRVAVGLEQTAWRSCWPYCTATAACRWRIRTCSSMWSAGSKSLRPVRIWRCCWQWSPACVTDRCRRTWWCLVKWVWPGRYARCQAARSASPRRRSTAFAAPLCPPPTCRKNPRRDAGLWREETRRCVKCL